MNGNCHFVYGAAVGTAVAINISNISAILPNISASPEMATLCVMGGLLGGIFPDIDNPSSHMGQLAAPVSTVIGAINKKLGKVGSNHRGILHDPLVYIVGLVLCYFFFPPMIGFFIGCLSHLFLDIFNGKGIPCGPIKRISIARIDGSSPVAYVVTWIFVFCIVGIGILIKVLI